MQMKVANCGAFCFSLSKSIKSILEPDFSFTNLKMMSE